MPPFLYLEQVFKGTIAVPEHLFCYQGGYCLNFVAFCVEPLEIAVVGAHDDDRLNPFR
jgi:hypothetical protein